MNIGVDIDGVIYPWHWSMYRFFCETKGFVGTQKEFWKYFRELDSESQDYYVSIHTLYGDSSMTEDAIEYLPKLAELGTLFYITSRPSDVKRQTEKFFDKYEPPFKENLIFSHDKANHIKVNKIAYFVDDVPANVDKVSPHTKAFLFTQPHNVEQREGYNIINSLHEYYKIIKEEKIKNELGYF